MISEFSLRGLWLRLQGCARPPAWVELSVDGAFFVFLDAGWRSFSRRLNLRDGDSILCRFDGEDTLIIPAFDAGGNRLDPYWEDSSSTGSGASASTSSSASSSAGGA